MARYGRRVHASFYKKPKIMVKGKEAKEFDIDELIKQSGRR